MSRSYFNEPISSIPLDTHIHFVHYEPIGSKIIVDALDGLGNVVRRQRPSAGLIDGATGEIENPMTYKYADTQ